MAMHAPPTPTTEQLHNLYPLSGAVEHRISVGREQIGGTLSGKYEGLVGVAGACAMTNDVTTIRHEGAELYELMQSEEGLYLANRRPMWKPRTDPTKWHGLETDDPELAYRTLAQEATYGAGVAVELNWQDAEHTETHAKRYGNMLTFAWIGGRAVNDTELVKRTALEAKNVPLAVKNGLDGEIQPALDQVDRIRQIRGEDGAPVVLLYRGGENAKDPQAWERQYRTALELTNGHMMVDAAHGTEMAHHSVIQTEEGPYRPFKKSVEGQEAALDHIEQIAAKHGELSRGVMAEASDAYSPTDPHIKHARALQSLVRLNVIRLALQPVQR